MALLFRSTINRSTHSISLPFRVENFSGEAKKHLFARHFLVVCEEQQFTERGTLRPLDSVHLLAVAFHQANKRGEGASNGWYECSKPSPFRFQTTRSTVLFCSCSRPRLIVEEFSYTFVFSSPFFQRLCLSMVHRSTALYSTARCVIVLVDFGPLLIGVDVTTFDVPAGVVPYIRTRVTVEMPIGAVLSLNGHNLAVVSITCE